MKILVLGGTGMAGHVITKYLLNSGHEVITLNRTEQPFCENIQLDVTQFEKLKNIVLTRDFDIIINSIGLLNYAAEKNKLKAISINSYLPHYLADITSNIKTKIIHLSTDCVFSGKDGGYFEDSYKDGQKFYDISKSLGEINDSANLTIRTSIIGPELEPNGQGLFDWFMNQENEVYGFTHAIWTGVTTVVLAQAIEEAIYQKITGLYHLVNNTKISKYDLLILFNSYFKNKNTNIIPKDKPQVDKSLFNSREDFNFNIPSYETMISNLRFWIENNNDLYSHYYKTPNTCGL